MRVSVSKQPDKPAIVRFVIDSEEYHKLAAGLRNPKARIMGNFGQGVRLAFSENGGLSLQPSGSNFTVSTSARRLRATHRRMSLVHVPTEWERDEEGPVLVVRNVPEELLDEELVLKTPKTIPVPITANMTEEEKKLFRQLEKAGYTRQEMEQTVEAVKYGKVEQLPDHLRRAVTTEDVLALADKWGAKTNLNLPEVTEEEFLEVLEKPEEVPEPVDRRTVEDLKMAIALVNECMGQLSDDVILTVDKEGKILAAKRRVTILTDL